MSEEEKKDGKTALKEGVFVGRVLVRPTIYMLPFLLNIFIPLIVCCLFGVGLYFILINIEPTKSYALIIVVITCPSCLFIYICLRLKSIIIWAVKVYQCIAPTQMRLSCCMNPSCSEYMILALKKYGLFKGLKKGIKRLKSCSPENENAGKEDLP